MKLTLAFGLVGQLFAVSLFAANIAVVDSGVDYKHQDLKLNIWQNPSPPDLKDADGTTYRDVRQGWNFAEKNNQVIDYKHLGTFSTDCTKIFEVQAKILNGSATAEEKAWYDAKKADPNFLKELQKFGNFVHGTHVSGISASDAEKSKVVAVKIIPTETPGAAIAEVAAEVRAASLESWDADNPMAKMFLTMLAKRQADLLISVGKFVAATGSEVANGSFGTSVKAVAPILGGVLEQFLGHKPTEQEKIDYAKFFISEVIKASKGFVDSSKSTLFVFAAGNDATNNDELPVSPANIKTDNTITVAATNGLTALASFSNYGSRMVEVAAPGVAILSTVPGDQKLKMSGTSMAAPFVTNVAGLVKDANPSLVAGNVKQILMETVDVKSFLSGKVATSGIVNRSRAVKAAELSRSMPLRQAIDQANAQVRAAEDFFWAPVSEVDLIVTPLPMLF